VICSERELPRLRKLHAEGTAAAASALHVRVVELEARTLDALDVVDFHAFEIHGAHLIDGNLEAIKVQNFIGIVGLVLKRHMVLETRAAAPDNRHAQSHRHGSLHLHDFLDLGTSDGREINHKVF
jgi:hypothetical protein